MEGFPPPPDKRVRFAGASFYQWPQLKWSFNHVQELGPTKSVFRGTGSARPLAYRDEGDEIEVSDLSLTTMDGRSLSFSAAINDTATDSLVVLHRGRIAYE